MRFFVKWDIDSDAHFADRLAICVFVNLVCADEVADERLNGVPQRIAKLRSDVVSPDVAIEVNEVHSVEVGRVNLHVVQLLKLISRATPKFSEFEKANIRRSGKPLDGIVRVFFSQRNTAIKIVSRNLKIQKISKKNIFAP